MAHRMAQLASAVLAALRVAWGDLTVVAIGDWGGDNDEQPTTESQRLTAQGLRRVAADSNANFTLLMGDNIYYHGLMDETSPRFRDTFEEVYASPLPGMPFYVMAGNHDYGQGVMANISAQIAYSQRSTAWNFPSLWYKIHRDFEVEGQARSLDVLVLDTVVLCGNEAVNEDYINEELRFLDGQHSRALGQSRREAAARRQWEWLRHELASSTAGYLWVTGHYPIWSPGNDGTSYCLVKDLRPLLIAHGAHYVSGHDHMLEHFEDEGLHSFVVGAGKECCYPTVNWFQPPPGTARYILAGEYGSKSDPQPPFAVFGGFASLRFARDAVVVTLHAHDGSALHKSQPLPRRAHSSFISTSALALLRSTILFGRPRYEMLLFGCFMFGICGAWLFVRRRNRGGHREQSFTEPLFHLSEAQVAA